MENIIFQINKNDNVATALSNIQKGNAKLTGETSEKEINVTTDIKDGHKIALCDIKEGEQIIKYGVSIGVATKNITKGSWVHLHVMKSNFDERSSHLDLYTGVPNDSEYV